MTLDGCASLKLSTDSLLDRIYAQMNSIFYPGDTLQMGLYRQFGVLWIRGDIHEN